MIDDETAQMADSHRFSISSGWPDFFNSSAWWTRAHRFKVVPNEDAEGADQEPGHENEWKGESVFYPIHGQNLEQPGMYEGLNILG